MPDEGENSGPDSTSELTEVRNRLNKLEAMLGKSLAHSEKLDVQLEAAWAQVAWFHRQMFGVKSERIPKAELQAAWRAFVEVQEGKIGPRPGWRADTDPVSLQLLLDFMGDRVNEGPGVAASADGEGGAADSARSDRQEAKGLDDAASPHTDTGVPGGADDDATKPKNRDEHGRTRLPGDLPVVETIILDPDEVKAVGPGTRLVDSEISYRLAVQSSRIVCIALVRHKYAVDNEDATKTKFVMAPPPAEMVSRGLFSPSALAHIVAMKWDRSVPYNRFGRFFESEGLKISKSTLSGVIIRAAPLAKVLVDAITEHARTVADVVGIDASGARILRGNERRKGHIWIRYVEDVASIVSFTAKHDGKTVAELLAGWRCTVLGDGASVYDAVVEEMNVPRGGCQSHLRRKFVYAAPTDSRALVGVRYVNQLFAIERELLDCSHDARLEQRRRRSKPIVEEFIVWRDHMLENASLAPRGLFAKALRYMRNQESRLFHFLNDGVVKAHNNDTELQIRHYAVGRRAWLFHGSAAGAEAAATWLTLVLTARMHDLPVEPYFRDLFRLLPIWPNKRVLELAPHRWARTRARLDSVQLAAEYGAIDIPAEI